jgi:ParB-like nuclease domain
MSEISMALTSIPVEQLDLDLDNPRFFHLRHRSGAPLKQEQIEHEIMEMDDDFPLLTRSIQKTGVKDPIWVIRNSAGRFTVIEGNRRTVVLKQLIREKVKPPQDVRYDKVQAHVIPSDTPPVELLLQKARLQSGKKAWGAFNEAALTFQLQQAPHFMAIEDIAVDLKLPMTKVKERIQNYKLFRDYTSITGDDNPKRFAYFSECPPKVRDWFTASDDQKRAYFGLISPTSGNYKIRSVATRGGLRDFAHVIEDKEALKVLLDDPDVTVEDALEIARDNNITKAIPFIKKLGIYATNLRSLTAEQLEKLRGEPRIKVDIKSLRSACDEVLARIERTTTD